MSLACSPTLTSTWRCDASTNTSLVTPAHVAPLLALCRFCRRQALTQRVSSCQLFFPSVRVTTHPLPPLPNAFAFGSALINAREAKGFTQRQLADASGVSLSAIKAYESGRNLPGARELREICQAVEVSPNRMLFGVEQPFSDRTTLDVLMQATSAPLDEHLLPLRLGTLAALLAPEERDALLTLGTSLAVARHGEEAVRAALRQTDGLAVITRSLMKATAEAHQSGTPIDVPGVIGEVERSLQTLEDGPIGLPKN